MTTSEKKNVIKVVAQSIITLSAGKVVHDAIDMNTDPQSRTDRARTKVGSFVIGGMIAERAWLHAETKIDKLFDLHDRFFGDEETTETTAEAESPTES